MKKRTIAFLLLLGALIMIRCDSGKSGDAPLLPIPSPPITNMYPIDIDFTGLPNGPLAGPTEIEGVKIDGQNAIVSDGVIEISPGELIFTPPDEISETAVMLNSDTASSLIRAVDKNGELVTQTTTWEYGDFYFFTVASDSLPKISRIEVIGPSTMVARAIFSRHFQHIEFEKTSELTLAVSASFVWSGDINNNNAIDVVISDISLPGLRIAYGDGSGDFPDVEPIITASTPAVIADGDFNNDGLLDLAVSLPSQGAVEVFANLGRTFSVGVIYPACVNVNSISTGDVNGDGWIDIAVGCDNGAGILTNAGDGFFRPYESVPACDAPVAVISLSDMDINKTIDMALAIKTPPSIEIWKGNNSGSSGFTKFQSIPLTSQPIFLLVQALNWDRYADALSVLAGIPNFASWINQKDGSLTRAQYFQVGEGSPSAGIALGDINADGFDDMVFAEKNGDISIFITDLFKQFQLVRIIQTGVTLVGISVNDVNNDRKGDIIAVDDKGVLLIYLNRSY